MPAMVPVRRRRTLVGWQPGQGRGGVLIQVLCGLLVAAALVEYLRRRRRLLTAGLGWPARRAAWFALGLLLVLAMTCGPVAHYDRVRYWVWVSQALVLLLVAP